MARDFSKVEHNGNIYDLQNAYNLIASGKWDATLKEVKKVTRLGDEECRKLAIFLKDAHNEATMTDEERAKREQFLWMKESDARTKNMPLSTCQSIPGYKIVEHCGLVFGDTYFRDSYIGSGQALGDNLIDAFSPGEHELTGSVETIERARNFAIKKLKREADKLHANAVIGIDSETSMGDNFIVQITLYGTAVRIEKE